MALFQEKFKTFKHVFDEFTISTIHRLISQGYFEGLQSPISVGKESNIFSALRKNNEKVIVKIYRLETVDFNHMYDYIKDDPRYPKLKKNRRQVIFNWAKREYRNLLLARKAGVAVPTPLGVANNVLVLEFIGDAQPAPKLKDSPPRNLRKFFQAVLANMKKLQAAGLVHGDLSQFNMLNYREHPVFIDFSHTTVLKNENSRYLLQRDVKNVCSYFRKLGLELDDQSILQQIMSVKQKTKN